MGHIFARGLLSPPPLPCFDDLGCPVFNGTNETIHQEHKLIALIQFSSLLIPMMVLQVAVLWQGKWKHSPEARWRACYMLSVGEPVLHGGIGLLCLFEWEPWCFNELKGLLILNLITLFRPSRLQAFTLIVIYGSSTLCFLINHLVIDIILFLCLSLSLLSNWVVCWLSAAVHTERLVFCTWFWEKESTELWGMGKHEIRSPTGSSHIHEKPNWQTYKSLNVLLQHILYCTCQSPASLGLWSFSQPFLVSTLNT